LCSFLWNSHLFYLHNFFYFLWQYLKRKFSKEIQSFFTFFWKVWTTNTPSLNLWVFEAYIRSNSRTVTFRKRNMAKHYGKDLCFVQDAVIIQKNQKKIKKLAKWKTWKGDLGKNERPGGSKTRKGGPGKNKGHGKNIFPVDWKPERAVQTKVRDFQNKRENKTKSMTAEAHHWRNTLRWSTNGDFFRTLSQQWALSSKRHQLLPYTGFYPLSGSTCSQ